MLMENKEAISLLIFSEAIKKVDCTLQLCVSVFVCFSSWGSWVSDGLKRLGTKRAPLDAHLELQEMLFLIAMSHFELHVGDQ